MLRYARAALIRAYQRHLSARKGYRCAYGVLHGTGTCSSIGLDMMEQQGFWAFWRKMPLQFDACRAAAATLSEEYGEQREARRRRQAENKKRDCSDIDDCDSPCGRGDSAWCEGECEWGEHEFGSCD